MGPRVKGALGDAASVTGGISRATLGRRKSTAGSLVLKHCGMGISSKCPVALLPNNLARTQAQLEARESRPAVGRLAHDKRASGALPASVKQGPTGGAGVELLSKFQPLEHGTQVHCIAGAGMVWMPLWIRSGRAASSPCSSRPACFLGHCLCVHVLVAATSISQRDKASDGSWPRN